MTTAPALPRCYYVKDHLGSVRTVVDATGAVQDLDIEAGIVSLRHAAGVTHPWNDRSPTMSLERITIDPAICHGKPCVRGLRYPVEMILELLSAGMTPQEILADYEDLEHEDILAVLTYAARLSQTKRVQPFSA